MSHDQAIRFINAKPEVYKVFRREAVSFDAESQTLDMLWDSDAALANPMGFVQGGFITAILDETAVLAGFVATEGQFVFPSLDFSVRFYKPVPLGKVLVRGRPVKIGKNIAFLHGVALGDAGEGLAEINITAQPYAVPERLAGAV